MRLSMSLGFARSENPVALHLANQVGFDRVIRMARFRNYDPSGGQFEHGAWWNELLYEMSQAYAIVANGKA